MGLGERVRRSREDAGLSQEALAYRAGVSASAVRGIEQERQVPRVDTLQRLARELGTTVGFLIGEAA